MTKETKTNENSSSNEKKKTCGIIMPISTIEGCSENHWEDVLVILKEAIQSVGYEAQLVSHADDVGVIQKRIIQNLYDNDIVVCDVSCKNANVMFELGLRLAFDKPTIIIIDDKTGFSFDTSPIEHLVYPRDLRYSKIIDFKNKLKEKIIGTIKSAEDTNYSPFLKHFGEFKVATIEHSEGSIHDVLLQELENIRYEIRAINSKKTPSPILRHLQMKENSIDEKINNIVKEKIKHYIEKSGTSINSLLKNENNEKNQLQNFLEQDKFLCSLCVSRERMQKAIDDNLFILDYDPLF